MFIIAYHIGFCSLAIYTARIYLRDRQYIRAAVTIGFAMILATCGAMAVADAMH